MTLTYKQFKIEVAPVMESLFGITKTRFILGEDLYTAVGRHPDSPFLCYCHAEKGWRGVKQGQWTLSLKGQEMDSVYDRLSDLVEDNKARRKTVKQVIEEINAQSPEPYFKPSKAGLELIDALSRLEIEPLILAVDKNADRL